MLTIVGFLAIAYFAICTSAMLWQNRLIFFPSPVITATPEQLGLAYEDVWLPVPARFGKFERIHGWWLPAVSEATGVLLYLHGNGENISANLGKAQVFHQLGFSVLMIDYRGYGRSEGNFPSEARVYQDVQVAEDYLLKQRGISPQDIFLYGHSLGGAIAIDLAVRNPEFAGLIVEGSFTSMHDMAKLQGKYGFLPLNLLLTQRFDSISKVTKLQMPLLLIHGSNDQVVPAQMSQALFNQANEPKQLWLVPGADHSDVAAVAGLEYQQQIKQFVEQVRACCS
ncbi:MAG: alpha/beta hydrolase [Symploca sp. SIO1C4]|uniref:Alpha/beta hydrolase n=1 Tax=Symploca sp. SIO1C4 TaxID=2607765 RepID=A0A6B3NFR2_9CYAN|nr:alpha/beta hydrolase [Symploca sp. SIO1C4]